MGYGLIVEGLVFLASSEFLIPLITRLFYLFGASLVTFAGSQYIVSAAVAYISNIGGLPSFTVWMLVNTGLTAGCNMIISAFTAALILKGLNNFSTVPLKRWVWHGPIGT
jgi:hypothetical protein